MNFADLLPLRYADVAVFAIFASHYYAVERYFAAASLLSLFRDAFFTLS